MKRILILSYEVSFCLSESAPKMVRLDLNMIELFISVVPKANFSPPLTDPGNGFQQLFFIS